MTGMMKSIVRNQVWTNIRKIAGYRENYILDDLAEIKLWQEDKTYLVYQFTSCDGQSFCYDLNSNRITG